MSRFFSRLQAWFPERVVVLLLVALSGVLGSYHLLIRTGPSWLHDYPMWPVVFGPSVMMACGKGFEEPVALEISGLPQFLAMETPAFVPAQAVDDMPTTPPSEWRQHHRYLLYLVGMVWRVLGISWNAVKVLLVALFCITIVLVYGLFRLGMNRYLSAAATVLFMVSPGVLFVLPNIRDFAKAPFVLGAILIMGYLCKKPVKTGVFLGLAALLGLVLGVGLGFRQDLFIGIPPSLLVLAFCAREGRGRKAVVQQRIAAVVLLLVCFAAGAGPVLRSYQRSGTPSHEISMGLATAFDDRLGMGRASYERMYTFDESLVLTAINRYARRVEHHAQPLVTDTPETEQVGKAFLFDTITTFPADLLTRAYAAVLWVIQGGTLQWPAAAFFFRLGPWLMAAVLVLLSCHSLRLAWLALLLSLYFCGYVSVQVMYRHCFHLSFVPFWLFGFLVDRLLHALTTQSHFILHPSSFILHPSSFIPPLRRMALFCLGAGLLIFVPFYALRAYQCYAVDNLLEKYASADLESLESEATPLGDCVLLRPTKGLPSQSWPLAPYVWQSQDEYLVAAFAANAQWRHFWIRYETQHGANNYSQPIRLPPTGEAETRKTKYFFPVYERAIFPSDRIPGWGRFAGLALSKDRQADFEGFYRVKNADQFSLLLNMAVPEDRAFFRPYQTVRPRRGDPDQQRDVLALDPDPRDLAREAGELKAKGDLEAAVPAYQDALRVYPHDMALCGGLGAALEAQGDSPAAAAAYRQAIGAVPEFFLSYYCLDELFAARNDLEGRVAEWRRAVQERPETAHSHCFLGMALHAAGDFDGAVEAYGKAIDLGGRNATVLGHLGRAQAHQGDFEAAKATCLEAIAAAPRLSEDAAESLAGAAAEFMREGDFDKAIEGYGIAVSLAPQSPRFRAGLGAGLARNGNPDGAFEAWREGIALDPEAWFCYHSLDTYFEARNDPASRVAEWQKAVHDYPKAVRPLFHLSMACQAAGKPGEAIEALEAAVAIDPDNMEVRCHLGCLLAQKGDFQGALQVVGRGGAALDPNYAGMVVDSLANTAAGFLTAGQWDKAIEGYRAAIAVAPDKGAGVYPDLVAALHAKKDYDGAWREVAVCRQKGVGLPDQLLKTLRRDSGKDAVVGRE